ncbi:uncharacterized protein K444DRAFT_580867 [Hyaloscypha bicolor E]|uniref:Uncharacterized protein n=1 Tax=Hyaloscypha bicolor E TaxID=1095630 RepID=A0A2J6TSW8_9HELO|nr:uncharacterized protein K444DRAFT_580867 [Hyaloscypha bicolor E]PMD66117.1 hypothetical protein K444DRAFT_580867 [Hyaloscypha bicolor E]
MSKLILLLPLTFAVRAYTEFDTTCTTPNVTTNFVSSPDSRGTLDILWSCLFTIIACTWTIQHLNVPEERNGTDPGWIGDIKWGLKRTWASAKWMIVTMLAPELVLSKAWEDLVVAQSDLKALQKLAGEDGTEWTVTHSLFANMGGQTAVPRDQTHALRHHNPFHLTAASILQLRTSRQLPKMPLISADDINDKSKTDSFARVVSVAQITWIVVQVLARVAKRLAVSQLEIAVVAFSSCAIMIYILQWKKPKSVLVPYTVLKFSGPIPVEIAREESDIRGGSNFRIFFGETEYVWHSLPQTNGRPIPNDVTPEHLAQADDNFHYFLLGLGLGSSLFGGIHVAAWNFTFPSKVELILWRVASIYCTVFFILFLVLLTIPDRFQWFEDQMTKLVSSLYVLARVFMVVEMFRTLCFLPPDAYTSTWATNIPHLA